MSGGDSDDDGGGDRNGWADDESKDCSIESLCEELAN
jgi:hypothetical protein